MRIRRPGFGLDRFFEVAQITITERQVEIAEFQIAVDRVFLDAINDDIATLESHLVSNFGGVGSQALFNFVFLDKTVNELPAIAPRCTPADTIGLEQHNVVATFGEMQHRRYAGKTAADYHDIAMLLTVEASKIRGNVGGRRVVGPGVFPAKVCLGVAHKTAGSRRRAAGVQVQHFHREVAGSERRDLANVVSRGDFDHIHADDVDSLQATQDRHGLMTA